MYSVYPQYGGGKCSLCGSEGTNKSTCPLNPNAKQNPSAHPLAILKTSQTPSVQEPVSKPIQAPKPILKPIPAPESVPEQEQEPEQAFEDLLEQAFKQATEESEESEEEIADNGAKFFQAIGNSTIIFEYKGEPLIAKSKLVKPFGEHQSRLRYTLNYLDPNKTKEFVKTCDFADRYLSPSGEIIYEFDMAFQEWSVKDGILYLENQENKYTRQTCKGNAFTTKIFQGAGRILWCIFLHHALKKKVITKDTLIELEAWGNLANVKHETAGQKALELFYEKLGFKRTGKKAPLGRGSGGPYMQATVGTVIGNVCEKLPNDVLEKISSQW